MTDAAALEFHSYTACARVAEGASSVVYRAQHRFLGFPAALKVLRPSVSPVMEERLVREARALFRVVHPNVVSVLDLGRTHAGQSFLVMEWVDGETLAAKLAREGAQEPRRAARIARDIALGLLAAHREGLVHRDLKPSNVMVADDGRAKLVDFGLVRAAPARALDDRGRITRAGLLLGTPLYMAPEVVRGEEATAASDVYALGVVLYELLAGKPPFGASCTSLRELLVEHVEAVPPMLPDHRGLGPLVEALLHKAPSARPSLEVALSTLEAVLDGQDVSDVMTIRSRPALLTGDLPPVVPAEPDPYSLTPLLPASVAPPASVTRPLLRAPPRSPSTRGPRARAVVDVLSVGLVVVASALVTLCLTL